MSAVERCLEQGNADPVLVNYLDEILSWRLSDEQWTDISKRAFEMFLDQLLIANPNNYSQLFPETLVEDHAKVRYRQLIVLFHPDRGEMDHAWLTYRAERLNTAYSSYRKLRVVDQAEKPATKSDRGDGPLRDATSTKRVRVMQKSTARENSSSFSRGLRRLLGSPEQFEKNVFIGLIALAAFFVGLILLSLLVS